MSETIERHGFGAEVGRLLDLVVHSLYSDREIFLRELVANAADRMIYLYKEGMAAPAGGFSTYGRVPRAVRVVDHGLRETARGDYATAVPLPRGGRYDVTFFVDAPRVVACFTADIGGPAAPEKPVPRVVALDPPAHLARGQAAHLRFAIHEIGPAPAQPTRDNWGPFVVPPRHYFSLGDNRDDSKDARFYGFVPRENLRGRPIFIYLSIDFDDWRLRWNRIGMLVR